MTCVCGSQIGDGLLVCPACHRLVHAEELRAIMARADAASTHTERLTELRKALALLPANTRQAEEIRARIGEAPPASDKKGLAGVLAAFGLLAWKLKSLLFGLTKLSTLLSMFLAFGVYWQLWGWKFAAGFVLGIYVHEMGHVVALQRLGIAATAPMFIPGVGAFVRLKDYPANPREDATVGLAGPIWGTLAAIALLIVAEFLGGGLWLALARTTAWINLFNLVPLGSLDGGRGFRALSKQQRILMIAVIAGAWALSAESLLMIVGLVAVVRVAGRDAPEAGDARIAATYATLIGVLSAIIWRGSLSS